ncbi:MAG: hypothetical protein ACHBN1_02415 [Heteroscytonema crispum UTEX LB 1556]
MVKSINHIINAHKTRLGASLQVMQLPENFECIIAFHHLNGIHNYSRFLWASFCEARKNYLRQWFSCLYNRNLYKKQFVFVVIGEKKTEPGFCKNSDQHLLLAKACICSWGYQKYTEQKAENHNKDIHILFKLYRSILGKYKYTSLELPVRTGAFMAYPPVNFHASNPVRVKSSDNKKEQCHRLWHCQTIVDS